MPEPSPGPVPAPGGPPPPDGPVPAAADRRTRTLLALLLVGTAVTYLWNLDRNGWANSYYAAAVQAGVESWKAFFYGSFDAGNFITVDKPPVSLWVMELSGRLFGFGTWSMLVPQALLGVGSVALLHATVRRVWGPAAGLLAGAGLAVMPVAALMFRFNNPDAALTFLLVLAAWTMTRALEQGRTRWLVATGAVLGCAFLTKELQALLVVPGLAVAYLVAGPPRPAARIRQLLLAGAVLMVSALWWPVLVDAVPAGNRPYIGGSTTNSVLELALGYNGLGRITGDQGVGPAGGGARGGPEPPVGVGGMPGGVPGGYGPGGGPGGSGGPGARFGGSPGIDRMLNQEFGGMSGWLLPAGLIGLLSGVWLTRRASRADPRRASLLLWGGWLLVTAGVLSFAGGIIHSYYTVALVPAVAACAGMVLPALWRSRSVAAARILLAASGATTAVTAFLLLGRASGWLPWLRWTVLAAGLVAAAGLLLTPLRTAATVSGSRGRGWGIRWGAAVAGAMALVAGLAAPAAWSLATVDSTHGGGAPSAGPVTGGRTGDPGTVLPAGRGEPGSRGAGPFPGGQLSGGQLPGGGQFPGGGQLPDGARVRGQGTVGDRAGSVPAELSALLRDAGSGYTWSAAAASSMTAGPLALASGTAVMALGGFNGHDRAISLDGFRAAAAGNRVRYYVTGGGFDGPGGQGGPGGGAGPGNPRKAGGGAGDGTIASWVSATFSSRTIGGWTVYDLSTPGR